MSLPVDNPTNSLRELLGIDQNDPDEDLGTVLTDCITAAVQDDLPRLSLADIVDALKETGASELEPLRVFPVVIGSSADDADALIDLMAVSCSAKEVVMAVEEVVENLEARLQSDDEDEDEGGLSISKAQQIIPIPRLLQWKKSPKKAVESRLSEIESIMSHVKGEASAGEGRSIIQAVSQLVAVLSQDADAETKVLLRHIVESTLTSFPNDPQAGLARQAFASHFRRLIVPQPQPSSVPREDVVITAWDALRSIGYPESYYLGTSSLAALILLAHSPLYTFSVSSVASIYPILLSLVQSNIALDETLAILINCLAPLRSVTPRPELEVDIIIPLVHLLPPLASNHSDPDIRHYTFRILSTVLGLSPSPVRFRLLNDLLSGEDTPPQMQIAAVGLLKEAIMEALSESAPNLFASPQLLNTFGPSVLRPNPPDILTAATAEDFLDGPESLRLVECLGLYYVLFQRDGQNRTGARDNATTNNVRRSLLDPLEVALERWKDELASDASGEHGHDGALQLDILSMWVERVRAVLVTTSGGDIQG
ncbi:hypothetical protein C2E23DRAFT_868640 [Lenzites betulinus]|nr:hypothetical protein C2E23DRAFT_868640 [Lenzites betulinus]